MIKSGHSGDHSPALPGGRPHPEECDKCEHVAETFGNTIIISSDCTTTCTWYLQITLVLCYEIQTRWLKTIKRTIQFKDTFKKAIVHRQQPDGALGH